MLRRDPSSPTPGAPRKRSALRAVGVIGLVSLCALGLSACRTIGPASTDVASAKPAVTSTTAPGQTAPVASTSSATPAFTAPPATTPSPSAAATTPARVAKSTHSTTPAGAAAAGATTAAGGMPSATSPATPASAAADAQPPKVVVDDPWTLVGQPYLHDNDSPDQIVAGGMTSFTLWFRTRGDFRGVRAGTPLTDPRHYKVGAITIPGLPGFIRQGTGGVKLADRRKHPNRYCWSAVVRVTGAPNKTLFPLYRDGAPLPVVFDLHGSTEQTRTATVVVDATVDRPLAPVQKALGCH